jgi:putative ABC transport system permease protein
VGVYGLVSFDTARRTREIGIRVALGAARGQVLALVLRDGMRVAIAGTLIGVPTAFALARLLSSLLFGVSPADAGAFAVSVTIVLLIVLFATIIPARRAVRVTPSTALRNP